MLLNYSCFCVFLEDVSYFRNLLVSETDRLTVLYNKWEDINDSTPGLTEEGNIIHLFFFIMPNLIRVH